MALRYITWQYGELWWAYTDPYIRNHANLLEYLTNWPLYTSENGFWATIKCQDLVQAFSAHTVQKTCQNWLLLKHGCIYCRLCNYMRGHINNLPILNLLSYGGWSVPKCWTFFLEGESAFFYLLWVTIFLATSKQTATHLACKYVDPNEETHLAWQILYPKLNMWPLTCQVMMCIIWNFPSMYLVCCRELWVTWQWTMMEGGYNWIFLWNKGEKQGVSESQQHVDLSGSVMHRLRVINMSTCFLTEIILNSNELLLHPYSAG